MTVALGHGRLLPVWSRASSIQAGKAQQTGEMVDVMNPFKTRG